MIERSPLVYVVTSEHARTRLDRVVAERWARERPTTHASRSVMKRWIDEGRVLVDGVPGRAAHPVTLGARIEITPGQPPTTELSPDASVRFSVMFEDEHLIVVDKPAGLVVHPARGHADGTLVHGLLSRGGFTLPSESGASDENLRPGIVHRLDKDTSGVMVVAKDERTREGLKALFQAHDIERSYLAIATGVVLERTIATLHGRHPSDRLRFSTRVAEGKRAVTHVAPVERFTRSDCTLVRCTLETGRTHQIRVHLAEIAHAPVLGDRVYGGKPRDPWVRGLGVALGHQALHAEVLGFVHPITGQRVRFASALPPDVETAIADLRLRERQSVDGSL